MRSRLQLSGQLVFRAVVYAIFALGILSCGYPARLTTKKVSISNELHSQIIGSINKSVSEGNVKRACLEAAQSPYLDQVPDLMVFTANCLINGNYSFDREYPSRVKFEAPVSYRNYANRDIRNAVKLYQEAYACGEESVGEIIKKLKAQLPKLASLECNKTTERIISNGTENVLAIVTVGIPLLPVAVALAPFMALSKHGSQSSATSLESPPFPQSGKAVTIRRLNSEGEWELGSRNVEANLNQVETVAGKVAIHYTMVPDQLPLCGVLSVKECFPSQSPRRCSFSLELLAGHSYTFSSRLLLRTDGKGPVKPYRGVCVAHDDTLQKAVKVVSPEIF